MRLRKLIRLRSVPSTQTRARRLAEAGAPAGTLVLAERQSRGRGRMDRSWSSGPGGLYFSLILRPEIRPSRLASMSLRAARVCARAVAEETDLRVRIKPPNDILAKRKDSSDPFRKVCGILLEAAGDTRRVHWVVLGVGVNASNRLPEGLSHAATLSGLCRRRISRRRILRSILVNL